MKTRIIASVERAHENDIEEIITQVRAEQLTSPTAQEYPPMAIRMLMAELLCDNWVLLK